MQPKWIRGGAEFFNPLEYVKGTDVKILQEADPFSRGLRAFVIQIFTGRESLMAGSQALLGSLPYPAHPHLIWFRAWNLPSPLPLCSSVGIAFQLDFFLPLGSKMFSEVVRVSGYCKLLLSARLGRTSGDR